MDDKYDYIIQEIISTKIDGRYVNKYHEQILGKQCVVDRLDIGYQGIMLIEAFGNHPTPRWYYTSNVCSVAKNIENGTLMVNTRHSTYILIPIEGGNEFDLPR